ncbi:MAG: hypothetical protein V7647_3916 [Acidobacteriota bacterium]|jgi:hypothetical protein
MADRNELQALQAALRGAVAMTAALTRISDRIMALAPEADIDAEEFEELARVTLAHAVSSQALRGLVEAMRRRRESGA